MLDGQLYMGESSIAGEIGHIAMVENDELCAYGNSGCLETFVSTLFLVRAAREIAWHNPSSSLHK